jgi:HK97 family phage prohead protease
MDHRNRAKLIDVPERRALAHPLELREAKDGSGNLVLEGYASTWDEYDCYGGPQAGGWVEQIDRSGVDRTLAERPDVMLLVNHEGLPLARTAHGGHPGTMTLKALKGGLFTSAMLDPEDPDVRQIAPKLKRHDLDEMSFAFRVKDQVWNNNYDHRLITELSLQKGDVSVVNYGMNPNTHVELMDTIGQLAQLGNKELLEVRGNIDRDVLRRASLTLERAWRGTSAQAMQSPSLEKDAERGVMVNGDGSHLLYEGQCVTCQGERNRGIEAGAYADLGYIGSVKRYPIDDTHVKSSWIAINQPRNHKGYSPEQLEDVTGNIRAAMKKAGHDVSELKSQDGQVEISHIEAVRQLGGGLHLVAVMTDGSRTPLPAVRQSGELVGAGAGDGGNPFGGMITVTAGGGGGGGMAGRTRTIGDQDPKDPSKDDGDEDDRAKGDKPPWLQGGDDKDPQDKAPDDKDPKDPKKPEKKSDEPDEDDQPTARDHGDGCPCSDCAAMRAAAADAATDDDEPDARSASERLAELRRTDELPDRPTVTEALGYLKRMA